MNSESKKIKETQHKKLLDEKKLENMFDSMEKENNETIDKLFLQYPHLNDCSIIYFHRAWETIHIFLYP